MSTYLVIKRLKQRGEDHMPQTLLVDPENAKILMDRGFITPVPDNFTPPTSSKASKEDAKLPETELPTVDQLLEVGYSQEAAELLASGETSELVESETKVLEEAVNARPDILELSRATEAKISVLLELSDEDYQELSREYLGGTVGAAAGDGGTSAAP